MATHVSFRVSGEAFRPSSLGFTFPEQEDVGAIAQTGPFKGHPRAVGPASYLVPRSVPYDQRLKHLADLFVPMIPKLREAGATNWEEWIGRYYYAQCNEEFSPEELKQLVRLDCALCYSAYSVTEAEEAQRRKEFGP